MFLIIDKYFVNHDTYNYFYTNVSLVLVLSVYSTLIYSYQYLQK